MQAAEMLRGTRPVYHLVFLIFLSVASAHPFPLQELPSIPGYIPVYIRHGDQPLEEINLALAEAFHETSSLSKDVKLDNGPNPEDVNSEDNASNRKIEAVHVRHVDNNFFDRNEKSGEATETETPEALTSNSDRASREKSKRKIVPKPVFKVAPPTEEEKKTLETFQIEAKEDTKILSSKQEKPNLQKKTSDSSSNISELSTDKPRRKHSKEDSNPPVKIDEILVDELDRPNLRLAANIPRDSKDKNAPVTSDESPVKEQRPPNVLSNVRKVTPSPEILLQLEKERAENQSLEEKSK